MVLVDLDKINEGQIIARNIYLSDGRVLLGAGVPFQKKYIKRLKHLGISSAYIIDERFKLFQDLIKVEDIISDATRLESIQVTKECMDNIVRGQNIDDRKVMKTINHIIDDLLSQKEILVNLSDIRTFDDYTFAHSSNVAVLSIMVGLRLGLNQLELRNLGIGALLHDVGKTHIPIEVLNKPGKLDEEEFNLIQNHSTYGFEIIRETKDLNLLAAHVAYQHHERYNGTGYPRKLQGEEISLFARIVAIADVYDALVADRPYRKRMLPHEAFEFLMAYSYTHFDHDLIKIFLQHIPPYPVGTMVRLNNGEKAVVIKQNAKILLRPVVIAFERGDLALCPPEERDLAKFYTLMIEEVL